MAAQTSELTGSGVTASREQEVSRGGGGPLAALKRFHGSMKASNTAYALIADIVQEVREDNPSLLARQAAYSLLYAIPSILIVVISIAAIVDKNTGSGISETLRAFIEGQAPGDLKPLLANLVQYALVETSENAAIVAFVVSLSIAVWSASGGVGALMFSIQEVYDIHDTRSFIKKTATRLLLMLLGGILVVGSLLFLAFGRVLLEWLPGDLVLNSPLGSVLNASPIWALGLIFISLMLLYWFSLDTPNSLRWLAPGAAVATAAIGLLFALLDLILSYSNPGAAYGVVGSVLVLLWVLFILSAIVIVGAIINAVLGRRFDRKLITGLQSRPFEMPKGSRVATSVYR